MDECQHAWWNEKMNIECSLKIQFWVDRLCFVGPMKSNFDERMKWFWTLQFCSTELRIEFCKIRSFGSCNMQASFQNFDTNTITVSGCDFDGHKEYANQIHMFRCGHAQISSGTDTSEQPAAISYNFFVDCTTANIRDDKWHVLYRRVHDTS